MQARSIGDDFDFYFLTRCTVVLCNIHRVIKRQIHHGGIVDTNLNGNAVHFPFSGMWCLRANRYAERKNCTAEC